MLDLACTLRRSSRFAVLLGLVAAASLGGSATVGCAAPSTEEDTDETSSGLTDISDCYDSGTTRHAAALEADGYASAGTSTYEVVYYRFGANHYWKTVTARRYEKGTSVRYATCKGVVASPVPLTASPISLTGQFYRYGCADAACRSYDWKSPFPGKATITPKSFGLRHLGGGAQLTVHIQATPGGTRPGESRIDEEVVLEKNGNAWSNAEKMISLEAVDDRFTAASITTRPKAYDPYDPAGTSLYHRYQFRFSSPVTPSASVKTVTLLDRAATSGIRAVPATLKFSPDEAGRVKIQNASSFAVRFEPTMGTAGTFQPGEDVTLDVGLPSLLRLTDTSGTALVVYLDLQP